VRDAVRNFETVKAFKGDLVVLWPKIEPWLKAALDEFPALLTTDDFKEGIESTRFDLWLVRWNADPVAAAVTEIVHGAHSMVNILAMGGVDMEYWVESFTNVMVAFARDLKCHYVVEMGRPGWKRVLKPLGWVEGPAAMMKPV
jgi:hypothetical protein